MIKSFVRGSESVARGQGSRPATRDLDICRLQCTSVRLPHPNRAGKLPNRPAPEDGLLFLHYLDVLPPDCGDGLTQSECPLGQLQIVCCKLHQIFGYARLSTLLCEPYAPFG